MKRRGAIILLVVFCLGALLAFLPRLIGGGTRGEHAALRLVPIDAALLVRVNDLPLLGRQLSEGGALWSVLSQGERGGRVNALLRRLETKLAGDEALRLALGHGEILFSLHLQGEDFAFLGVVRPEGRSLDLVRAASLLLPEGWAADSSRRYSGVEVVAYCGKGADSALRCFLTTCQGVTLVSSSRILLERAVRMAETVGGLPADATFMDLYGAAGQRESANVFCNLPVLMPRLAGELLPDWRKEVSGAATAWTKWVALDFTGKEEQISCNGLSRLVDTLEQGSTVLAGQRPCGVTIVDAIPDACPLFLRWGARDISALVQRFSAERSDIELFSKVCDREVALAFLPHATRMPQESWIVVMGTESPSEALRLLTESGSGAKYDGELVIDRTAKIPLYCWERADFFRGVLGGVVPHGVSRFFMQLDRFLIFAPSEGILREVMISSVRQKMLGRSERWAEMGRSLQSECNFMLYAVPASWRDWGGAVFTNAFRSDLASHEESLRHLMGFSLQLSSAGNIIFYNAFLRYGVVGSRRARTVWETRLEAPVTGRPLLMSSHITHGREVLVQDSLGGIYLVNGVGRILWRRPLGEQILGDPQQVDLYKNGKLQYVFTTPTRIWAVDRNGNDVEGFPVVLPAAATAPLAVFDYERSRDYRFAVPCANRELLMFDNRGRRVVGFAPAKSEAEVADLMRFVRVGGRDHIIYSDPNRLYILNRRGEERVRTESPVHRAVGSSIAFETRGAGRILLVDREGYFTTISLQDGKVERVKLSGWCEGSVVEFVDLTDNGFLDLVIVEERGVRSVAQDGTEIFSRQFKSPLAPGVQVFHFGKGDWRIGLLEPESDRIWLLRGDGEVCAGFPLVGSTLFSIGHMEQSDYQFNLVVGSGHGMLLNYGVSD